MMTKEEFINELRRRLRSLPESDANDAIEYYENYLNDAGDEVEQAIAGLGAPAEVAATILAEYVTKESTKDKSIVTPKRGLSVAWAVILAVFAAPIALPLPALVVIVAIALFISLLAVLFSLGIAGAAAILAGIIYVIAGFAAISQGIAMVLMFIGSGLVAIGVGILLIKATTVLSKYGIMGINKFVGKFILKKNAAKADQQNG